MATKKTPMPNKRRRRRSRAIPVWISLLILLFIFFITLALDLVGITDIYNGIGEPAVTTTTAPPPTVTSGTVEIHMIDVGQGDSILIKTPEANMLFDAGDNKSEHEEAIKAYLDAEGVQHIDYVIFTHHDADHIGGADMVLSTYSIGEVIMKPYTYSSETKVYKDMMAEIEKKDIKVTNPSDGDTFSVGELQAKVLGPTKDFKDKNEDSIVMRLDYGENSILMTGDAEHKSEAEILKKYGAAALDVDVLKVGHHGSDTSTSDAFLAAVTPEISIISSNPKGNNFGHPKPVTIEKLTAAGSTIYRTDTIGDIVLIFDGKNITYEQP